MVKLLYFSRLLGKRRIDMFTEERVNLVINISSITGVVIILISLIFLYFGLDNDCGLIDIFSDLSVNICNVNDYSFQLRVLTSIVYGYLFFIPYSLKWVFNNWIKIVRICFWTALIISLVLVVLSLFAFLFSFGECELSIDHPNFESCSSSPGMMSYISSFSFKYGAIGIICCILSILLKEYLSSFIITRR